MHIGLASYSPEQWTLLKHVADDPEKMDDDYDVIREDAAVRTPDCR